MCSIWVCVAYANHTQTVRKPCAEHTQTARRKHAQLNARSLKPQSDIHCNCSATSSRPKLKTITEVAEESQLGFAVGRRLVHYWSATNRGLIADWSATSWGPLCDLMQLVADRSGAGPRLIADQLPIGREPSQLKTVIKKKYIDNF